MGELSWGSVSLSGWRFKEDGNDDGNTKDDEKCDRESRVVMGLCAHGNLNQNRVVFVLMRNRCEKSGLCIDERCTQTKKRSRRFVSCDRC